MTKTYALPTSRLICLGSARAETKDSDIGDEPEAFGSPLVYQS